MQKIYSLYNLQLMLSTFLPFYLLPPVSKFRGVFGGRKLFLPGHFGLIFDGRVDENKYICIDPTKFQASSSFRSGR